ncbi:hypothetical protein SAMN02910355_0213 [Terrisporobacter glycolicus]|nr:hypothetical protein SAMN02910355_0213 [Terrisporobacter glycolicus]
MKPVVKKLTISLFCLIVVLVGTGCKKSDVNITGVKTGQYKKEKINKLKNRKFEDIVDVDNKNIVAVATDPKKNIYFLTSKDRGANWFEKKIKLDSKKGNNFRIIKINILENGDIAIFYTTEDTGLQVNYTLVNNMSNIKNTSNKDFFLVVGNEIIQIDGKTKKEKNKYKNDEIIESYVVINNSLIVSTEQKNIKYNIETGKKIGELKDLQSEIKMNL